MGFQDAMILGGVPALIMLISTYIGLGKEVPEDVSGALQHFAAGVLLCTVGTELLPQIVRAEGWWENIAAFVGFFWGVAVLILLGLFSPEAAPADGGEGPEKGDPVEDNNDDNAKKDAALRQNSITSFTSDDENGFGHFNKGFFPSPTPGQKQELREGRFVIAGRKFRQRQTIRNCAGRLVLKRSMSLSSLPMVTSERDPLLSASSPNKKNNSKNDDSLSPDNSYTEEQKAPTTSDDTKAFSTTPPTPAAAVVVKQFPLVFVLAVAIDSTLDGLLIGIASVAGPSAGPMMSASLSVEMGFLGLTLATALYGQSSKAALAALVGPACLVLGAGGGGIIADTVSQSPVALIGMLSFGASALLFMVAEELLLDAHEDGEHVWWVDLQLYTGFFASMMAGKFVG